MRKKEPDKVEEKAFQNIFPGGIITGLIGHEENSFIKKCVIILDVFIVSVK
jgi:hypothetical protein